MLRINPSKNICFSYMLCKILTEKENRGKKTSQKQTKGTSLHICVIYILSFVYCHLIRGPWASHL